MAVALVHVDHHVADLFIGLQVLTADVDVVLGEHGVDLGEDAGNVAVDMQQTVHVRVRRQGHLREVHRAQGGAVVGVADQLLGHFGADVFLGFVGGAADVRRQDHVVELTQRADELVVVALGLFREHVDGGAEQVLVAQRGGQRLDVHHLAPGVVDQIALGLHGANLLFADHPAGGGGVRHVQADHVGQAEQVIEAAHLFRVAHRQLGDHVVEVHLHAHGFRQHRHLGADVAVADDAQLLAADLVAVLGGFQPAATVGHRVLFRDAAHQVDGVSDHQLRHRPGVGVGRVEHRNAALEGGLQIHLVGADTETAHADQLFGGLEDLLGELGARADADKMGVLDGVLEVVAGERGGQKLHVAVAVRLQIIHRVLVDALEQEDADLVLLKRSVGHGWSL